MSLVTSLMYLADTVPPHLTTAGALMASALVTLIMGVTRGGRGAVLQLPGVLFIFAGAAAFWAHETPSLQPWAGIPVGTAAAALLVHAIVAARRREDPRAVDALFPRTARHSLGATLAVVAAILLYHLGTYSGALLTWEAPVVAGFPDVGGFAAAVDRREGVVQYTLQRFLWDDGLLSAGHTSLFYGAPTYALFHVIGFSPGSLRIVSVVATLLSVVVVFAVARRFFGATVAVAAAVAFGLNSCVLFYGRYGSSPAGTLLAVLLALWCVWRFLEHDRPAWWGGMACAATLFVATLQYATARLVVLTLLGFTAATLLWRWRRLEWQQVAGAAIIAVAATGVWQLESVFDRTGSFLYARGEQYLDLIDSPEYIEELFGTNLLGRPLTHDTITFTDKVELLYRVVEVTLPQLFDLIRPVVERDPLSDVTHQGALPQLYYAPLGLLIALGVMHSVVRLRAWPHACLLVWLVAGSVPLLLTNRVDSHRAMLLVIPLSFWAALGVWETARLMRAAQVPADVQLFFAFVVAVTVVYNDVHLLHREPLPHNRIAQTVATEVIAIPGRIAIGALTNHRALAWLYLVAMERNRRDANGTAEVLDERLLRRVQDGAGAPDLAASELRPLLDTATLLLAPATRFTGVAAALHAQGMRVAERGTGRSRLWRIDAGAVASGVPDSDLRPLAVVAVPPTPTPMPLRAGPQVSLTALTPADVTYDFAAPIINRTWADTAIIMGGVTYAQGIGTHAQSRMTFGVPPSAVGFQAVIGLSEEVRDCNVAGVSFEVRDQDDALLFDSGFIDPAHSPQPVVIDLHGATAITLVVTDGGNGRDCDHANWAQPVFLLER